MGFVKHSRTRVEPVHISVHYWKYLQLFVAHERTKPVNSVVRHSSRGMILVRMSCNIIDESIYLCIYIYIFISIRVFSLFSADTLFLHRWMWSSLAVFSASAAPVAGGQAVCEAECAEWGLESRFWEQHLYEWWHCQRMMSLESDDELSRSWNVQIWSTEHIHTYTV